MNLSELISAFSFEKSESFLNQIEECLLYHTNESELIPSISTLNEIVIPNHSLYSRYLSLLAKIGTKFSCSLSITLETYFTLTQLVFDPSENVTFLKAVVSFQSSLFQTIYRSYIENSAVDQDLWLKFYNYSLLICERLDEILNDGIKNLILKLRYEMIFSFTGPQAFSSEYERVGEEMLEKWLSLRTSSSLQASSIIIILNLSITLIKSRPHLIPFVLPALLDLHENPPKQFTQNQLKSVQHSLKLQLVNISKLSDIPAQVIPFIDEALIELGVGKSATLSKSLSRRKVAALAQAAKEKQRKMKELQQQEEDEAEQSKIDTEEEDFSQIDPTCIPLPWIVELLMSSLSSCSFNLLQSCTNNWKPPLAQIGLAKKVTRDPRLAKSEQAVAVPMEIVSYPASPLASQINSDLNPEQNLLKIIFERILKNEKVVCELGVRDKWASLLTKLSIYLSSGEDTTDNSTSKNIQDVFINFVFENFRERADLAIIWLHKEWINDYISSSSNQSYTPKYPALFLEFLNRLEASIDAKDKTLSKFLTEAPNLLDCQKVIEILRHYCNDPNRIALALFTLKDLIIQRPSVKHVFLPILLEYCFSSKSDCRSAAIQLVCKFLSSEQYVIDMAIRKFSVYLNASQSLASGQASNLSDDYLEIVGIIPSFQVDSMFQENCDLFFELLSENINLFSILFKNYSLVGNQCKLYIRNSLSNVISRISDSQRKISDFLSVTEEFPLNCSLLIFRIFISLREKVEALDKAFNLLIQHRTDEYILLPFIGPLMKDNFVEKFLFPLSQAIANFAVEKTALQGTSPIEPEKLTNISEMTISEPTTANHSDPSSSNEIHFTLEMKKRISQETVARIVKSEYELITPLDLLLFLHRNENTIGLKKTVDCIQICFSLSTIFTQTVFAQALQTLIESPSLPTAFMRTVIQAVSLFKALQPVVLSVLSKLVIRRIWEHAKLWEGFMRCIKIVLPHSLPIVIQLPIEPFKDLVHKCVDLVPYIRQYIAQQPPSLQHRLFQHSSVLDKITSA